MEATKDKTTEQLRLQFQILQEQQSQRLQKWLEKKKEISTYDKQQSQKSSSGQEDLCVDLPENKEDSSSRLLKEENRQLQERLRELRDENGRAHKLLSEKEFEINSLKKREEDRLASVGPEGLAGDVAATKIVELSKKIRELSMENEKEKAKNKQLINRMRDLERELQDTKVLSKGVKADNKPDLRCSKQEATPQVKCLEEKLKTVELKLCEYRNQIQALQQELKVSHKVLSSEIGEGMSVQQILSTPGSWRGRAQQILALQSRVKDLEASMLRKETSQRNQDKNQKFIHNLERNRKEALEKRNVEYELLLSEHSEVKKKLESSKARNNILTAELKTLKSQQAKLIEKDRHDNEFIEALLKQQAELQAALIRLSQKDGQRGDAEQKDDTQETQRFTDLITQLRGLVEDREEKVQELEYKIQQLTHTKQEATDGEVRIGHAHTIPREDGDRMSSSARDQSEAWCLACAALQTQCSEFKAVCQAANVERDRLLELTRLQQRREEEALQKCTDAEQRLREERRRCVVLEQQLERLKLDAERGQKVNRTRTGSLSVPEKQDSVSPGGTAQPYGDAQMVELGALVTAQQEEVEGLRATLKQVLQAKEEDLQLYTTLISQVKHVFLQAIRRHKQKTQETQMESDRDY